MNFRQILAVALTAVAVEARSIRRETSDATLPIVNTTLGQLQGSLSNFRSPLVTSYKGIPYAKAPTGDLRWKAPVAAEPWDGVFNATEFGPQCMQIYSDAGIFSSGKETMSEDCLTLNIWTPTYNDTSDLTSLNTPVYFWIFGGRFEGGSGDVKTYDGSGLASKGVIVVTLNYRLGAFGYLAHPDLQAEDANNSTGNYGIMDQQFALKWVHENIANFGGNPEQIVVGGQSAGSSSALDVMYSPLTDGLGVAGIIAESGARGPQDEMTGGLATSYRNFTWAISEGENFVANSLNVSTIAEARNISAETLATFGNDMDTSMDGTPFIAASAAYSDPPYWRPTIDGYVLAYKYGEALLTGNHLDVPILTGNNKDESGAAPDTDLTVAEFTSEMTSVMQNYSTEFFKLWPAGDNSTAASDQFNTFFRDLSRVSTWTWVKDWIAGGATSKVYTYYWTHTPAENSGNGAYHGSELWYTFNNIPYADYDNVTWTEEDYQIESIMSDYWVNFISTGNPNGAGTSNLTNFIETTSDSAQTMWLGDSWGASYLAESDERVQFILNWLSIFDMY
ncbi:alpha/beta-hydrolase [Cryphonectria parasitica EP155]|uniref:Carboxylic ester hydrolase n=1 Tax=Cryphonectria parasitica (strain ATCC 38755 / EP155) TaxID=660469 RepID=A0A9P5CR51_CRYP1|nr:alpha/beta-hydrolase [Cryphonectria parasitica EP155]KAF3766745.1 alpha/beta-hydrolase [Cryphonectria parasitica EP155]